MPTKCDAIGMPCACGSWHEWSDGTFGQPGMWPNQLPNGELPGTVITVQTPKGPRATGGGPQASIKADQKQIGGDHYRTLAIQPSEYVYRNQLNWYEGNAVKYITRHRIKGGRQDIEKAIHYLELLLEAEYPSTTESPQQEMKLDENRD